MRNVRGVFLSASLTAFLNACAAALFCFFSAAAARAETVRWEFNDDSEADAWRFFEGAWELSGGLLRHSHLSRGGFAVAGDPLWEDIAVEARMRIDEASAVSHIGMAFRVNENPDDIAGGDPDIAGRGLAYFIRMNSEEGSNSLQLGAFQWVEPEDWSGNYVSVKLYGPALAVGEWFVMRVEARGGESRLYINERLHNVQNDIVPGRGAVGLYAHSCAASFDYVRVVHPLNVQPQAPLATRWADLKTE